jgi:hypothetical protein
LVELATSSAEASLSAIIIPGVSAIISIVAAADPAAAADTVSGFIAPSSAAAAAATCAAGESKFAAAATPDGTRFIWKHDRHSTGRPCVGLKGTVVSIPHAEHDVRVSVRENGNGVAPFALAALPNPARLALHNLHRLGSFLNCLS